MGGYGFQPPGYGLDPYGDPSGVMLATGSASQSQPATGSVATIGGTGNSEPSNNIGGGVIG